LESAGGNCCIQTSNMTLNRSEYKNFLSKSESDFIDAIGEGRMPRAPPVVAARNQQEPVALVALVEGKDDKD
jgi:hypothetical protein